MRFLYLAASAALASSLATAQQDISFEIDISPPTGANATDPNLGSWVNAGLGGQVTIDQDESVRFRITGATGMWVRPIMDFLFDDSDTAAAELVSDEANPLGEAPYPWLVQSAPQQLSLLQPQLETLFQLPQQTPLSTYVTANSSTQTIVRPDSFLRWLSFGVNNGSTTLGSAGAQNWFQPILGNAATGSLLWTTGAEGWTSGNGITSNNLWIGMLNRDSASPATFDLYACVKWAVMERSVFVTGNGNAALDLFRSQDWNTIVTNSWLDLAIQIAGMRAPVTPGSFPTYSSVPGLFDPDTPLVSVSPGFTFTIFRPQPLDPVEFHGIHESPLQPGQNLVFRSSLALNPVKVEFPVMENGVLLTKEVTAIATPTFLDPTAFTVVVPTTVTPGNVRISHGNLPFTNMGPVLVAN